MSPSKETLGERLRKRRLERGIGLRELAGRVGISPTYLSRVETNDEKSPPAEKPLRALAHELELDPDELLMLAGRVAADVVEILTTQPGWPEFLRTAAAKKVDPEEVKRLLESGPGKGKRK